MILMINFSWQSIIGRGWYLPWGIEHHRFSHFIECSFRSLWDTFQNFLIAPWLNTFNLRLAAATLSTTADSKKLVALWTIRENDHNVTETRRIFWISWTFRRVPTPDMMTVASQWFPANKVLLMITPFAEKVLYMNWKSALILNGSKMQKRILDLATHFKADNKVKIMIYELRKKDGSHL